MTKNKLKEYQNEDLVRLIELAGGQLYYLSKRGLIEAKTRLPDLFNCLGWDIDVAEIISPILRKGYLKESNEDSLSGYFGISTPDFADHSPEIVGYWVLYNPSEAGDKIKWKIEF